MRPSGDPAAPPDKTERGSGANGLCFRTQASTATAVIPPSQRSLDLERAWEFSRGAGQLIAVIDTGVQPHPRLPDLWAGGDYVAAGGNGTEDCDVHGTVVAGIIGATQVKNEGFSGVAPEARILSIRQTSSLYQTEGAGRDKTPEDRPDGYGKVSSLASAIVRAADFGARVINISLVSCLSASPADVSAFRALGAAVQYAAVEHDAVIISAAGNTDDACKSGNPGTNPLKPAQDLWSTIRTYVNPAWYDDYVLSVGAIDANGAPSSFSVPGPWVGIAAPGEGITSLDARTTGISDGKYDNQGKYLAYSGTSFASPYVAGVAALVRDRFPDLSAKQVIERLQATAHAPAEGWNPYIGYGAVDPVAALTNEVPKELPPKQASPARSQQLAVPAPPPPADNTARNVALIGSGAIGLILVLGVLASFPIRRKFGMSVDDL
ncbi:MULTISPECIES: type VII secretion-associated serine protease mycosin [Nocardia]|uniref:type VII secretion-associated serine protease mycosin n=1 Tax=Nocardia TaxID=1817 RepID=UPI00207BA43C|nr:type VII secretion-associated serine protease mycosin [Nocardia salmonicida]